MWPVKPSGAGYRLNPILQRQYKATGVLDHGFMPSRPILILCSTDSYTMFDGFLTIRSSPKSSIVPDRPRQVLASLEGNSSLTSTGIDNERAVPEMSVVQ